jgi:hypothetical protein
MFLVHAGSRSEEFDGFTNYVYSGYLLSKKPPLIRLLLISPFLENLFPLGFQRHLELAFPPSSIGGILVAELLKPSFTSLRNYKIASVKSIIHSLIKVEE